MYFGNNLLRVFCEKVLIGRLLSPFCCLRCVLVCGQAAKQLLTNRATFWVPEKMPWWLLGMSMVATTFSTDTPNLVTNIVRTSGVAGNWSWWSFPVNRNVDYLCVCQTLAPSAGDH